MNQHLVDNFTIEGEPELYPRHQGQPIILHCNQPHTELTAEHSALVTLVL